MLLRICKFRENRRNREGHAFLNIVQDITFTRIPYNGMTLKKCKIHIGEVGVG
jgi:hypothetical protein